MVVVLLVTKTILHMICLVHGFTLLRWLSSMKPMKKTDVFKWLLIGVKLLQFCQTLQKTKNSRDIWPYHLFKVDQNMGLLSRNIFMVLHNSMHMIKNILLVCVANFARQFLYLDNMIDTFRINIWTDCGPFPKLDKSDKLEWLKLKCKPGDVVFFNSFVPHFSVRDE